MSTTLTPTPLQVQLARIIGLQRTKGHDHCRLPAQDLGRPMNVRVDCYAVLSEIVTIEALYRAGLQPQDYVPLAETAQRGPDFTLNGTGFDIKAVLPPDKTKPDSVPRFLCVNENQRIDPAHGTTYILPVVFGTGKDHLTMQVNQPVHVEAVGNWTLRVAHSEYRSTSVAHLAPLTDLRELECYTRKVIA